jgi:predicted GH43/DUF377 family glycosyl hydrolase
MPGYSLNHPMQGGFDAWFYNGLGGIQPDPARPGFKHTVIRPDFPADLGWARAEYDSIHGRIQSAWHRVNGGLRLDVTIPANTTATVCLEAAPADVRESGSALDETEGVSGVSTENGELRIELGSGDYSFAIGQEEEDGMKIDAATVKEWSEAYRGWQYYPNHVVSAELEPSLGFEAVDCPLVWRHDGEWRMFYTGFDGQGYQTALAVSDDLVHWEPAGRVMGFGKAGAYDHGGVAFCGALFDSYDAGGPRTLKKWNGRYWALYSCYPRQGGYELRPGAEGAAWSEDGETWHRLSDDTPTLSIEGAEPWEEDCIYAPWLLEHEGQFWDFYNAAQASREQMGLAVSNNMADWVRYPGNPVLRNGPAGSYDEQFCSDGKVYRDGDHWTMLYFGVGQGGAHVMAAYSRNLFHWTRDPEPLYQAGGHPGGLDRQYAHKVNLVKDPETGVSYLFYCAVGDQGRGIGLLTSEPL